MANIKLNQYEKEIVVIVTPKGQIPDKILVDEELIHTPRKQEITPCVYNYGFVEGHSDAESGYDRIVISDRILSRHQRVKTFDTGLSITVEDKDYPGEKIEYKLVIHSELIAPIRANIEETMMSSIGYYKDLEKKGLMKIIETDWGFLEKSTSKTRWEEHTSPKNKEQKRSKVQ